MYGPKSILKDHVWPPHQNLPTPALGTPLANLQPVKLLTWSGVRGRAWARHIATADEFCAWLKCLVMHLVLLRLLWRASVSTSTSTSSKCWSTLTMLTPLSCFIMSQEPLLIKVSYVSNNLSSVSICMNILLGHISNWHDFQP